MDHAHSNVYVRMHVKIDDRWIYVECDHLMKQRVHLDTPTIIFAMLRRFYSKQEGVALKYNELLIAWCAEIECAHC